MQKIVHKCLIFLYICINILCDLRFVYSIHLFLGGIYLTECAIRRRDSADDLYIWAHSALICIKKQFLSSDCVKRRVLVTGARTRARLYLTSTRLSASLLFKQKKSLIFIYTSMFSQCLRCISVREVGITPNRFL